MEKYYRLPVANSVIRLSSVEYVTPVVSFNSANTLWGFRVVYNNYSRVPPRVRVDSSLPGSNVETLPGSWMENSFNGTVVSDDKTKLDSYRNDLISVLTDNGTNLVDNFPGE